VRPHGRLRGRPQGGEGRWEAVRALSSRPFCSCEGRPGKPVVIIRRAQVHDPFYADAYEHNEAEAAKLVNLYALVSKMRVLSAPRIVETADRVVRVIIETYLAPNKTFRDVVEILDNEAMNPLREFSNACREELRGRDSS
jgi:hypothetical protein